MSFSLAMPVLAEFMRWLMYYEANFRTWLLFLCEWFTFVALWFLIMAMRHWEWLHFDAELPMCLACIYKLLVYLHVFCNSFQCSCSYCRGCSKFDLHLTCLDTLNAKNILPGRFGQGLKAATVRAGCGQAADGGADAHKRRGRRRADGWAHP